MAGPSIPGASGGYTTDLGQMVCGLAEDVLRTSLEQLAGTVQLIFTSPPFPLRTKKSYGNLDGEEYLRWLASFGPLFRRLLSPTGSVVVEIGKPGSRAVL